MLLRVHSRVLHNFSLTADTEARPELSLCISGHSSSLNVHCVVLPQCQESPWTCISSPLSVVLPQSGIIIEGECIHRLLCLCWPLWILAISPIHPPQPILGRSYILPPPPRTKTDEGNFSPPRHVAIPANPTTAVPPSRICCSAPSRKLTEMQSFQSFTKFILSIL